MNSIWSAGSSWIGGNVFTEKGLTFIFSGITAYFVLLIIKKYAGVKKGREKLIILIPLSIFVLGLGFSFLDFI